MNSRNMLNFVVPLALLAAAGPAMAHAHLESAMPAVNDAVTPAPSALSLTFSEGLNLAFSGVDLNDSKGTAVETDRPSLDGAGGTVLVVPLKATLTPGAYTVNWHVLSSDGHKTQGSYSFTVKP